MPPEGSFGRIVLDLGLMTWDQLDEALAIQKARQEGGDFARLGHILVEKGYLTPAQVQEVLEAQKIIILSCASCSARYNIRGYSPRFQYECPRCHGDLAPGEVESVAVEDQLQANHTDTQAVLTRPTDETNTAKIRMLKQLGKYEILGEIARGGMGIIYKARQGDLDRIVAVKTLRKEELEKEDAADAFISEAQSIAGLRHPNIVAVHEVGSFRGIQYFTMDFIEGLPLDRILLRGPLEPGRAVEVVLAMADALQYAHRKGVVHRDLKPANIIVSQEDGTPFLVDFGIAKKITVDGPRQLYDEEEDLLGSIPYMAPEYVEGAAYDETCDLYSLGVVLYESLAGANALPYYDDDTRRFLEKIITCEFKPITEWVPGLDLELVTILERMICPRARRYPTMNAAARALRRWLVANDTNTPVGGYRLPRNLAPKPDELKPNAAPIVTEEEGSAPTTNLKGKRSSDEARALADEPDESGLERQEIVTEASGSSESSTPAPGSGVSAPGTTEPARAPAPEVPRSATPLALLLFAALAGVAWTTHRLDVTQQEVRKAEESRREADRDAQRTRSLMRLQFAEQLRDLGHSAEALSQCDGILSGAPDPMEPALAPVYLLRGTLRKALGKPGFQQDLDRAAKLGK